MISTDSIEPSATTKKTKNTDQEYMKASLNNYIQNKCNAGSFDILKPDQVKGMF